jgi:hypothetical protein
VLIGLLLTVGFLSSGGYGEEPKKSAAKLDD